MSDAIFQQMSAAMQTQGPDLVNKVKGIVRFVIKGGNTWTVNLKTGSGSVQQTDQGKADLTVTVAEADFLALAAGQANPQQLFMKGKIKAKGNMGLAMKLGSVMQAAKAAGQVPPAAGAAAPAAAPAAPAGNYKSAAVFAQIQEAVGTQGEQLAGQVNGSFQFVITDASKKELAKWAVVLKPGNVSVTQGAAAGKVDLTVTVSDDDFFALSQGQANPQQLFMKGKLKAKGNMGKAMSLGKVLQAARPSSRL